MRRSTLVAALGVLFGSTLAGGYGLAAAESDIAPAAKPIPTITVGLPPPAGTPPSQVPQHNPTVPGLGRTTAAFLKGQALLAVNRYVERATNGQRLSVVRADPWTMKNGKLYGVNIVVTIATPVVGARWLPVVSHTDAANQHLTSAPDGDAYSRKWVHLELEHVTRFWALVDFRHSRVASFLPVIADEKPPYHLVDPAHYNLNITATPPR